VAKKSKKEAAKELDVTTTSIKRSASPRARKPKQKATAAGRPSLPQSPSIAPVRQPSDDEIRLRAYFIAERRMQLQLEGDSTHDWMEARRQLIEEAQHSQS